MAACKENEELIYQDENTALNIWLANGSSILDSVTHNFAYTTPGRDSIMFNYRVIGGTSKIDRTFELEAVGKDQDYVYYNFGDYTIKAGQYQGSFPIYIDKPEVYNEFKTFPGRITFRLKETTDFKKGVSELSQINVVFRNAISKPDNWDVAADYRYRALNYYFGAYSDVKYGLMIQTLQTHSFMIYLVSFANPNPNNPNMINSITADYYKRLCVSALAEYELANGPLIDENGNVVKF